MNYNNIAPEAQQNSSLTPEATAAMLTAPMVLPEPLDVSLYDFAKAFRFGDNPIFNFRVLPPKLKNLRKPTKDDLHPFSKQKVPYFAWLQSVLAPYGVRSTPCNEALALTLLQAEKNSTVQKMRRINGGADSRAVYFIVNQGGTKKEDIQQVTAFFNEDDELSLEEQYRRAVSWSIPPNIIVKTRSSLHCYWLALEGTSINRWEAVQRTFTVYGNSDTTLTDLPQLMRVPGFDHTTFDFETGQVSRVPVTLLKFDIEQRHTADQMLEMLAALGSPEVSKADYDKWLRARNQKNQQRVNARIERERNGAASPIYNGVPPKNLQQVHSDILSRLTIVGPSGDGLRAVCPCCEDPSPSLIVTLTADRILITCHATCTFTELCAAIGVEQRHCFAKPPKPPSGSGQPLKNVYDHLESNGESLADDEPVEPEAIRLMMDDRVDHEQAASEIDDSGPVFDREDLRDDAGNTARFLNRYGAITKYLEARKKFYSFDGKLWSDRQTLVEHRASLIVKSLRDVNRGQYDEDQWLDHYLKSAKPERRNAILTFARSEIKVEFEEFDANPKLFNVANGTIDLTTGEIHDHNPADLCTKISNVKFDKHAKCDLWLEFLNGIFNRRQDLISFIQRAAGYSLSALIVEQVFFLLYGVGKNGKSTFLKVLAAILGQYRIHAQMETFAARNRANNGHSDDLASLRGARLVTAVETEESKRLSEGLIKQITGGDSITASFKGESNFTFDPTFKLWLAANHKPVIRGTDEGIWRRPLLIPFDVQFEIDPNKRKPGQCKGDKYMEAKLMGQLSGILNWALQGFRDWEKDGLNPPEIVRIATEQYRKDSDLIQGFIDECLETINQTPSIPYTESGGDYQSNIYGSYCAWAKNTGEFAKSQKEFGAALKEKGYVAFRDKKSGRTRYEDTYVRTTNASNPEPSEGSEPCFQSTST
jgi:P4 family phage/plasmid primase-like protien